MKKIIPILLIFTMVMVSAACGSNPEPKRNGTPGSNTVQSVLEQQMTDAAPDKDNTAAESDSPPVPDNAEAPAAAKTDSEGSTEYDVDLTKLSSTMVYSEVYNMMLAPNDYIGKTVKMKGQFAYFQNPDTKAQYFACIIADATACCSQGLEFILAGEYRYPDDYPELGAEITVAGIFSSYEENSVRYYTLNDAVMEA